MELIIGDERDLELLYEAIDVVIEEANARNFELSLTDLTRRLFAAYLLGERDPEKLADAVLFNSSRQIH